MKPGKPFDLAAIGVDASTLASANALKSSLADLAAVEALKSAHAMSDLQWFNASRSMMDSVLESRRAIEDLSKPFGGIALMMSSITAQHAQTDKLFRETLGGTIGELVRKYQWESVLGSHDIAKLNALFPPQSFLQEEVARLHRETQAAFNGFGIEQARMRDALGLKLSIDASLNVTQLKMSAFAGITDMVGSFAPSRTLVYESLFGTWRTTPDLPENFWRDTRVRRRMYREAEADPGLITASPGVALDIMVESGLTSGARADGKVVAVIRLGDNAMTISSRGTSVDAFNLVQFLENALRDYVARKLEERCGPKWFQERVDGNTQGNAKRIRRAALERGEKAMGPIHYTELGDLARIILSPKNWNDIFGEIFVNRADFDHDMQKLVATRRPVMHNRPIDGLRLVELVCVVQRISDRMEDDGGWLAIAESDE